MEKEEKKENNALALNINDDLKAKLQKKYAERNEELLLDKLEQMAIMKENMKKLKREIELLAGKNVFEG